MKLNLSIGNSYSQLTGFDQQLFKLLRKELSYDPNPEAARFSRFGGPQLRYLIDAKGNFPTGLLGRVQALIGPHTSTDTRKRPGKPFPTSPVQLDGLKAYPDQLNATKICLKEGRAGVSMPTGSGKSVVIALLTLNSLKAGLKVLIVVPTLELRKQLTSDLIARLKTKKGWAVFNIDSPELKKATDYDCLVLDEVHHAAAKTYQDLNKKSWGKIYYRWFLSGTYFRNQDHEQLPFEALAGKVSFKLTHAEAVERGYIVPVESYYVELPKVPVKGETWAQVYSELVVNNDYRNHQIASLMVQLNAAQTPTLCLVKEIAHGNKLAELTGFPFVNGQDEESRAYIGQFNAGKIKVLIGTEGVVSEGVDTKPCEFVLVCGLGKAKSALLQKVGRGVRRYPGKESCKVVLFRDTSHRWTLQHFKEQCKILKEELGVIAVKLEM